MTKVFKKRLCRVCGKKGIKFASDGCLICGATWVSDTVWDIALRKNQTENNVLKKNSEFITYQNYKLRDKYNKKKGQRKNTKNSGINLVPDSIFGISIYVLLILFCIWIFSDFGGECGVDYAPRFFGEC
ncbi:hypothetical protein [Candidatus Pelagibacter sp. HIMB1623]|uniref:hypothetical protein n=1 Tax=Candidatus Pelagibacter sp. HIMB1623 TaxID=3413358 RepID=UPI003F82B6B2